MDAIEEKISIIDGALSDIKTAIIAKGETPSGDITTYSDAINNLTVASTTTLAVTPTTSSQSFIPSGTYNGYSTITVSGVTSAIDSNIVAGNIKKDVSILGVAGTLEQGVIPSGTLTITETGTFDISNYEFIEVLIETNQLKQLAVSYDTTWVLKTDGTLWGCGKNDYGQQGSGNTTDVTTFTQRLTNVESVVASTNTTWALKKDGTLWGCGSNWGGQQGSGTQGDGTHVLTFTQRLTGVKQAFCGGDSTTWALKTDGTLWGCGYNTYGQQGSGDTTKVTTFTQRLTDVKSVVASTRTTWALKKDGTLWGCGNNEYGQQGSGNTTNVTTFTQRGSSINIDKVSASGDSLWVISTDGTLYGCGSALRGQQGSGNTTDVTTLTQRMTNVAKVECSTDQGTWAIKKDGTLWGCGASNYGQQGHGDTTITNIKTFTQRLTNVDSVYPNGSATWALKKDGTLWGCGNNERGQQGNGESGSGKKVVVFTQRLSNVSSFFSGGSTSWVIKKDDTFWGCGNNERGQQGSGNTTNVTTFTQRTLS